MGLADDWRRLVAALTGRPDTVEEARVAALFQNRSALKKELSELDDERHRLLDRLKLQEGSTMRVEEQLANLEQYLGRPGEGRKCLVYFQLRAIWRAAARRLEQFASELARQQKDRERKQQLADFERDKRARLDEVDRDIYEARILADQLDSDQAADRGRVDALRGFWNYFRRRRLLQELAERETRIEAARRSLGELDHRRRGIDAEAGPTFMGTSVEGRRAVNLAVIAYAEGLCERLAGSNLALLARQASLTRVYDADFGSEAQCDALLQATTRALTDLERMQDDLADIKRRSDRLRAGAGWRGHADTIPLQESVGPRDPGGRGSVNVLLDEYFDIQKALLD
jgi:hypothetical protein